ncbi:MAG TPA: hypothetical protein VHS31_05745 [Tepidisphaeraceae bacterium]|jgi:hypothetical protein|nr:hypothetical protein [Tepidisphaeraceae bacterium]
MIRASLLAETKDLDLWSIAVPVLGLIAGIIILFALVQWMKKKIRRTETVTPGGFSLADLRQLVKQGKMTPEEFELAKAKVLNETKRATAVKPAQETSSTKQFPPAI